MRRCPLHDGRDLFWRRSLFLFSASHSRSRSLALQLPRSLFAALASSFIRSRGIAVEKNISEDSFCIELRSYLALRGHGSLRRMHSEHRIEVLPRLFVQEVPAHPIVSLAQFVQRQDQQRPGEEQVPTEMHEIHAGHGHGEHGHDAEGNLQEDAAEKGTQMRKQTQTRR